MNARERMKYVRLLEKVNRNKAYAQTIGLKDQSIFISQTKERGRKDGIQRK